MNFDFIINDSCINELCLLNDFDHCHLCKYVTLATRVKKTAKIMSKEKDIGPTV